MNGYAELKRPLKNDLTQAMLFGFIADLFKLNSLAPQFRILLPTKRNVLEQLLNECHNLFGHRINIRSKSGLELTVSIHDKLGEIPLYRIG